MPYGKLKVLLVSAKAKVDPYAVLSCQSQSQKSSVLRGRYEWNETYDFIISSSASELEIKILDEDVLTADDVLGKIKIPLDLVFERGQLPVTYYNVVSKSNKIRGEVKLSLSFAPEPELPVKEIGGSKQPFYSREPQRGPYGLRTPNCTKHHPVSGREIVCGIPFQDTDCSVGTCCPSLHALLPGFDRVSSVITRWPALCILLQV